MNKLALIVAVLTYPLPKYKLSMALRVRDNLTHQLVRMFEDAIANSWTHKHLLDYRTKWILNSQAYKRSPQWVIHYLWGVQDVYFNILIPRAQVWTHKLDGKVVISGSKELSGRYSELNTDESCHRWKTSMLPY